MADAAPRNVAHECLQEAGLIKLCPDRPRTPGIGAAAFSVPALGVYVFFGYVYANGRSGWQEAGLTLATWLSVLWFAFMISDAQAPLWRGASHRLVLLLRLSNLALVAIAGAVFFGRSSILQDFRGGNPKAYNLALVLVVAVVVGVMAVGGWRVVAASAWRTLKVERGDIRDAVAAMPEMLFVVAFVVIIGDVWRVIGPLAGWRVEVLLILFALLCGLALLLRCWGRLRGVWHLDAPAAVKEVQHRAVREETPADLRRLLPCVEGLVAESVPEPQRMGFGTRCNVVLIALLPLLLRLLVACLVLATLLFLVGILLMDADRLPGDLRALLAPGNPPSATSVSFAVVAVAAAKVAGILSGLATVVVAVCDSGQVLDKMATRRIDHVRAHAAVWAAHFAEPKDPPPWWTPDRPLVSGATAP